jgi:uncharacterized delta-60 repeat protein
MNFKRFLRAMRNRAALAALVGLVFSGSPSAAPGDLDLSFNATGSFGPFQFTTGNTYPRAMALQPDGRLLVAGYCEKSNANPDTDFCVLRLNHDGTLDPTFTGPSGTAPGLFTLPLGYAVELLVAVRLQSDGKIVLAGTCGSSGSTGVFCLARLNSNGSLDETFDGPPLTDGNGIFELSFGSGPSGDTLVDMFIQPDDKIVVAGICRPTIYDRFCVARLNGNNGSYDVNFDGPDAAGSGVGTGNGRFLLRVGTASSDSETLGALALQADGGIVMGGICNGTMCMMRLLGGNGSFDASFDGSSSGNGRWAQNITNCPNGCQVRGIAEVQADGSTDRRLVIAIYVGQSGSPSYEVGLLGPTGSASSGMTGGGTTLTRILLQYPFADVTRLIESAGARLVLGTGGSTLIARFTPHFGPGWGAERGVTRGVTGMLFVFAVTQQPDGRVVVVGRGAGNTLVVQRLQGGPYDCTGDYDGDGVVRATVDSLIGTRIALGMNSAAVISGITFPAGATRTTWPAIRDYMIQSCGFGALQ